MSDVSWKYTEEQIQFIKRFARLCTSGHDLCPGLYTDKWFVQPSLTEDFAFVGTLSEHTRPILRGHFFPFKFTFGFVENQIEIMIDFPPQISIIFGSPEICIPMINRPTEDKDFASIMQAIHNEFFFSKQKGSISADREPYEKAAKEMDVRAFLAPHTTQPSGVTRLWFQDG